MTQLDEQWRTYDEFAAGIDTFRLPPLAAAGTRLGLTLDDGSLLHVELDGDRARWTATGPLAQPEPADDPYDAVAVREDVTFLNLPLSSRPREAVTIVWSSTTGRAIVVRSVIAEEASEDVPQVSQDFWAATVDGIPVSGDVPAASRDLIGRRNLYRYSPEHLYEHVYLSSRRYSWQCLEGVQRGHGDTDLATVWKLEQDLYLFCFREFRIAVASVWLHDLGSQQRTTGVFLGLTSTGEAEHSRAGGHVIPLGAVRYPDTQPV